MHITTRLYTYQNKNTIVKLYKKPALNVKFIMKRIFQWEIGCLGVLFREKCNCKRKGER